MQLHGIARLRSKAQPVRVELEKGETPLPAQPHYLGQVIPHGRFTAGELDVEGTAVRHEHVVEPRDLVEAEIAFPAGGGEADRAAEVAAPCEFEQDAAALAVSGAEAAVVRAAVGRPVPGTVSTPGEVLVHAALPDERVKKTVVGAGLDEVHIPVSGHGFFGVYRPETDGADALCPCKHVVHQARPRS